jgi:hypothetical protein
MNAVVAKRFTKRQQMQWSPEGALLLLQVQPQALNGELEQTFRGWYPGSQMTVAAENLQQAAYSTGFACSP